jgi:hypothetical protein
MAHPHAGGDTRFHVMKRRPTLAPIRQVVHAAEWIRAAGRGRWRITGDRGIPRKTRDPHSVGARRTRELLFDGPQFSGWDQADDAV